MEYSQKDIERFWSKVDKEKSTTFYNGTRCWVWKCGKDKDGYGQFWSSKTNHRAHHTAYVLSFGEIPKGLLACHRCDNPSCCNPNHLFLGTTQENVDDKISKGHLCAGEKHGMHKLTKDQVEEIRRRYKRFARGGDSSYKLAREFGLNQAHVSDIVNHKVWK